MTNEKIYRLLHIGFDDTVYQLNSKQKKEINEARNAIDQNKGGPSDKVNKEIDEIIKS